MRPHKILSLAAVATLWATIALAVDPTPVSVPEDASERLLCGPFTDVDGVTYVTPAAVSASLDWIASSNLWCGVYSTASPTPTPGTCTSISALTSCGLCAAGARKNLNCAANADCQSSTDSTSTCTIGAGKCLVYTIPYDEFRLTDRNKATPKARLTCRWSWTDSGAVVQQGKSWIDLAVQRSTTDVLHAP